MIEASPTEYDTVFAILQRGVGIADEIGMESTLPVKCLMYQSVFILLVHYAPDILLA